MIAEERVSVVDILALLKSSALLSISSPVQSYVVLLWHMAKMNLPVTYCVWSSFRNSFQIMLTFISKNVTSAQMSEKQTPKTVITPLLK